MQKIEDELTHLKLSRQRKYALRHPDKVKEIQARYEASEKAKERKRNYYHRLKTKLKPSPKVIE